MQIAGSGVWEDEYQVSTRSPSHYTEDVPAKDWLALGIMGMAGLIAIGLLAEPPWRSVVLVLSPVALLLARLVDPPRALWLEGDVLVLKARGRRTRLRLDDLVKIERPWVPFKGDNLVFESNTGDRIELLSLTRETEALRHELGRRLGNRRTVIRMDRRTDALLGPADS